MHANTPVPTTTKQNKSKTGGLKRLIRAVASDDEDESPEVTTSTLHADPTKLWRSEYRSYLDTVEATPPAGMTTIQWWGVSLCFIFI